MKVSSPVSSTTLYDRVLAIVADLAIKAEATGEVQIFEWGDTKRKKIVRHGQIVGTYRVTGLEITIRPSIDHITIDPLAEPMPKRSRRRNNAKKIKGAA